MKAFLKSIVVIRKVSIIFCRKVPGNFEIVLLKYCLRSEKLVYLHVGYNKCLQQNAIEHSKKVYTQL